MSYHRNGVGMVQINYILDMQTPYSSQHMLQRKDILKSATLFSWFFLKN